MARWINCSACGDAARQEVAAYGRCAHRLTNLADGDGRYLLTLSEELFALQSSRAARRQGALGELLQKRAPAYDKDREEHYNLISALHKSIRGSDPDAALYWLARMVAGGEDLLFIARRLVRAAAEDIGLADPTALLIATPRRMRCISSARRRRAAFGASCDPSRHRAEIQRGIHRLEASQAAAHETGALGPPMHIRNAPTKLMKELGYGSGYSYDHDAEGGFSGQNYFPDEMKRRQFYAPEGRGREGAIKERLEHWAKVRAERASEK